MMPENTFEYRKYIWALDRDSIYCFIANRDCGAVDGSLVIRAGTKFRGNLRNTIIRSLLTVFAPSKLSEDLGKIKPVIEIIKGE